MPVSKHTRKGVVRKHTNRTAGVHVNGKKAGRKNSRLNIVKF